MTGTAWRRPAARISRWARGTLARPISTPRSPRATMSASEAAASSSRAARASFRSILETIQGRRPGATRAMSRRSCATCAGLRTNESPTKSTGDQALGEIPPVLPRQGGRRESRIGEVDARTALHRAADLDGRKERTFRARPDAQADTAVVEPHLGARPDVLEERRIGHREAHGAPRLAGGGDARKKLDGPPACERYGAAGQRADTDLRAAEVEEDARRGAPRLSLIHISE